MLRTRSRASVIPVDDQECVPQVRGREAPRPRAADHRRRALSIRGGRRRAGVALVAARPGVEQGEVVAGPGLAWLGLGLGLGLGVGLGLALGLAFALGLGLG